MEIDDDYDHEPHSGLEYITENVLFTPTSEETLNTEEYKQLEDLFNSLLMNSCCCSGTDQQVKCSHGGSYVSKSTGVVILNENRKCKDLIYECSSMCKCDPTTCRNRLVQFGPRKNLRVQISKKLPKQQELITTAEIPKGSFICEYAGEVLTRNEAKRRESQYKSGSEVEECRNYIMCLNECALNGQKEESLKTFVDPTRRGNIGRYLNHSCEPNCELFSVRVDCPVPKIGIFAKRDIEALEELTFHYGGGLVVKKDASGGDNGILCMCGAVCCQKYLPNIEF